MTGATLLSVELTVARGSGPRGACVLTRLSDRWLTFDGSAQPVPGDALRVTNALHVEETVEPAIIKADRMSTVVWQIERDRE